jgi:EAL domain-containing protein (putative c-di-GMP-specific phosphodiesterase class I)
LPDERNSILDGKNDMAQLPTYFSKMPIVDVRNGSVFGYEILLREFMGIPLKVFNQYKVMYELHHKQIVDAVFQLDRQHKIRSQHQRLFFNLTPNQLAQESLCQCLRVLHRSSGQKLVIELTEDKLSLSNLLLVKNLERLTGAGCELAIDDFNTKESTMQRVKELKPDYIKFDKSLIINVVEDTNARTFLHHLVEFFHELDINVIVEGIETHEQYCVCKAINADFVQGYYFSLPTCL